jgi:hypothetical protein
MIYKRSRHEESGYVYPLPVLEPDFSIRLDAPFIVTTRDRSFMSRFQDIVNKYIRKVNIVYDRSKNAYYIKNSHQLLAEL